MNEGKNDTHTKTKTAATTQGAARMHVEVRRQGARMWEHGLTLDAPISNRFQSPQIVLKPQSYKRAGLFKSKAVHHVGRSGRDAGWIAG